MSQTAKTFAFIIGALLVIALITYVATTMKSESVLAPAGPIATSTVDAQKNAETGIESPNEKADLPQGYTMAEVAAHGTAADCWTAIRGNVFDLTSFVSKHPGGKGIVRVCGKDGTSIFNSEHGGSQMQESTLASFQIGVVKN